MVTAALTVSDQIPSNCFAKTNYLHRQRIRPADDAEINRVSDLFVCLWLTLMRYDGRRLGQKQSAKALRNVNSIPIPDILLKCSDSIEQPVRTLSRTL